jgi:hypothetical protein
MISRLSSKKHHVIRHVSAVSSLWYEAVTNYCCRAFAYSPIEHEIMVV